MTPDPDTLIPAVNHVPIDGSDPTTMILAWGLVGLIRWVVQTWRPAWYPKVRKGLPIAAFLIAVFLRAAWDAIEGGGITTATVARAFAAGAGAVLIHSQARELMKSTTIPEAPEGPGSRPTSGPRQPGAKTPVRGPAVKPKPSPTSGEPTLPTEDHTP